MESIRQLPNLFKALAAAQGEIETAKKDTTNTFFRAKYADLASCWDACREALAKHGLSVVQLPSAEDERLETRSSFRQRKARSRRRSTSFSASRSKRFSATNPGSRFRRC